MRKLSLQWRITLMTILLIGVTCVTMKLLLCSSGVHYMDFIGESLQDYPTGGEPAFFDPQMAEPGQDVTIVIHGAQEDFCMTNWYITAAVTVLGGILAYFVSGHALKASAQLYLSGRKGAAEHALADMQMNEDTLPVFRQLSHSFNKMLERLNNAFAAQRQFTGNAADEAANTAGADASTTGTIFRRASRRAARVRPIFSSCCGSRRTQTLLTQMTKTLLEMSNLQQVARDRAGSSWRPWSKRFLRGLLALSGETQHHPGSRNLETAS